MPHAPLIRTLLLAALAAGGTAAPAQSTPAPSRGQLLYEAHCIECHGAQMHWRTRKQAHDWESLKAQVDRWQEIGMLGWGPADVEEVSRYLNQTIYKFAQPDDRMGRN